MAEFVYQCSLVLRILLRKECLKFMSISVKPCAEVEENNDLLISEY